MNKVTPGAFGAQPGDANAPNKKRKLIIQKLQPPPEIRQKMIIDDKIKMPKNPIMRFFKKFFNKDDGY